MKYILYLLIFAAAAFNTFAQDLPNNLTPSEKELLKSYRPPVPLFASPPPSQVRTMAEWEPQQGLLITWTSYTSILRQIVAAAQTECPVFIVCSDSNSVKSFLTSGGVPLINLKFIYASFNSIWCRDFGPWTVYKDDADSLYIIDWIYNRPRPLDDLVPNAVASFINRPIYTATAAPYNLTHTGGNFMVDGNGTGFASKLILTENSGKTEAEIDTIMKKFLGLKRFIKMTTLPYDEIHHIDMHMKLLDEETLLVGEYPAGIADGPQIETNLQYVLNNFQTCYGRPYKVVRIPMPPDAQGRYPNSGGDYRTYTNSVFVNNTIIVPIYNSPYDTTAFRIYHEALPGYKIVGIDCNAIIPSLGAIHCISKENGIDYPVFISHPRLSGTVPSNGGYEVKAYIKSKTGIANAYVCWRIDTTALFEPVSMTAVGDTFTARIPEQIQNTKVYYYIITHSNDDKSVRRPISAPAWCYTFSAGAVVPVELVSFTAYAEGNKVSLIWSTATEINNKGFEVERKAGDWEKIAFVKGAGNSTSDLNYSFTDKTPLNGKTLYRLKQIDYDGSYKYYDPVEINVNIPDKFSLSQNYPNPFNPVTFIQYQVPEESQVTLSVFNINGEKLTDIVNEVKQAGYYTVNFNLSSVGEKLSSGIYFYRLTAINNNSGKSYISTKKMILLK